MVFWRSCCLILFWSGLVCFPFSFQLLILSDFSLILEFWNVDRNFNFELQNSIDGVANDLWCDATCREENVGPTYFIVIAFHSHRIYQNLYLIFCPFCSGQCINGCKSWKKALDLHSSCSVPCLYVSSAILLPDIVDIIR